MTRASDALVNCTPYPRLTGIDDQLRDLHTARLGEANEMQRATFRCVLAAFTSLAVLPDAPCVFCPNNCDISYDAGGWTKLGVSTTAQWTSRN
jgi:hypothetical protein